MKNLNIIIALLLISLTGSSQSLSEKIQLASIQITQLDQKKAILNEQLENLKLQKIVADIETVGLPAILPGDQLVKHSALILSFAPAFKQARWVAHIITPDVINGVVFRTNDFRPDTLVKSGTAVEADYFLTSMKPDSSLVYDGFGYDRGHLAPSADFRWSQKALSESYLYSNMSPQVADFNRGAWGDLEDAIRGYLYRNPTTQLYVLSGPVLKSGLPVIERSINKVSIPETYWKVIYDPAKKEAIGFIMPNRKIEEPILKFAVSVDEVEKLTGLDFFSKVDPAIQQKMEAKANPAIWLPKTNFINVEPLDQESLPRNHFNTEVAKQFTKDNKTITVCGTVVGARLSRAGNVLINLDKAFPDQVFTVFIKKENIINFSYKPEAYLNGKVVFVKGKIIDQGGIPTMYINNENEITIQ